jgi:hypothetical protein
MDDVPWAFLFFTPTPEMWTWIGMRVALEVGNR